MFCIIVNTAILKNKLFTRNYFSHLKNKHVSIIGAGPAGLTAAYFLSEKNIKPVVFEAGKETGGLGGSVNLWGSSYDIGPHIFLEGSQQDAVNFWKEIGGNDLQTIVLSRGMLIKKKLMPFPPKPLELLKVFGLINFFVAGLDLLKAKTKKNKLQKTAGDFFKNKYGTYFNDNVFDPFCEKYIGLPAAKVNLSFATGLTSFVKESGKTDANTDKRKLKSMIYPKSGTKIMWSRIAEKVLNKGEIHLSKKLIKVITNKNKIVKLCFSDGSEAEPQFVISSLPIVLLLQLLDNKPQALLDKAKELTYRNTILVYIRIKGTAFAHQYITVFDHSIEAGRISNFNSWTNDKTDKNESVLCVEYWCNTDDANWTISNEDIISKAIIELENMHIILKDKVTGAEVFRVPNSHPTLSLGHSNALMEINNFLSGFENLALAGRHATFKWDGQADNIIAGMQLAEKIEMYFKTN